MLAEEFPEDRLAATFFRLDYNYSLYSYERFYDRDSGALMSIVPFMARRWGSTRTVWLDRAASTQLWWDDIDLLRVSVRCAAAEPGLLLPVLPDTNSSHCVDDSRISTTPRPKPSCDAVSYITSGRETGDVASLRTLAWAGSDMDVGGDT